MVYMILSKLVVLDPNARKGSKVRAVRAVQESIRVLCVLVMLSVELM